MENIRQVEIPNSDLSQEFDHIKEAKLIDLCRNKDKAAFKELYDRYSGRVYSLSLRLSADRENAKDITQETFISVWKNIASFNGESAFYTWLHKIAVNNFLMLKRKNSNSTESLSRKHNDINPENYASTFSTRIDVEKAISKLPEQSRMVFVMFDIEGYKHEEIGSMLGIASGTSKAQLHRARKFLRNELTK